MIDKAKQCLLYKEKSNMAKLGRYSADRKKVENLTADKTAEVADCGTLFTVVGDTAITVTLPAIAQAGNGWWCKFLKTGATGGDAVNVTASADAGSMMGVAVTELTLDSLSGDDLAIAADAEPGSQVELVCDGSNWHVLAHASGSSAITVS
jgi:hypothetical protein